MTDPDLVERIKEQAVALAEQALHVGELEARLRATERALETPEARRAETERQLTSSLSDENAAKQRHAAERIFNPPRKGS